MDLSATLGLAFLAGLSIPAGALVSSNAKLRSVCIRHEIDSFVSYFGGGALLAAVALVLIPYGMERAETLHAAALFLAGGIIFWRFDHWMKRILFGTADALLQRRHSLFDFPGYRPRSLA